MAEKENTVLVVGGSVLQCYMIREAQGMGLRVLCTDGNQECPGAALADEFLDVSTYDIAGHKEVGTYFRGRLVGVVTSGADVAPAVATAAEGAGVRRIPPEVAKRTHSKLAVRELLERGGLDHYSPKWLYIDRYVSCNAILSCVTEYIGWPCVLKPVAERAGRGVSLVQNESELQKAVKKALSFGTDLLLEQQLNGSEHSVEVIFDDTGDVLWFNAVDRYFDYRHGFPLELGHINPTCLNATKQADIYDMILAAAKALGVMWGPFKIDCMMTKEGPKILECTARLSGGFDAQWTSPVTNRNPQRLLLQLACGLPKDMQPPMAEAEGYGVAPAILIQKTGKLENIHVPTSALEWIHSAESRGDDYMDRDVVIMIKEGDQVHPAQHNGERAGYVLFHGEHYGSTWIRAKGVADEIAATMVIL